MIYIETGSMDVCWNFALEEYFAERKRLDDMVFLLWRTEPTLMVGKYQNTYSEVSVPYAREHGIRIVRRMSGGGTIYTDPGGWQFSFIDHDASSDTIVFSAYTRPILDALQALGVDAQFNGRNDILIGGKKISGNAQYKLNGATVHHGSLLFDTRIDQMVASTTVDDEKIRTKSIRSVRERVTNISEHLPEPMTVLEFKRHVIDHVMGQGAGLYALDDDDRAAIERIAREKYASWDWTFGKNPRFAMTRSARFPAGRIEFQFDTVGNVITGAAVYGDFFAGQKADQLAASLTGCPYDPDAIRRRLSQSGIDGSIYGITLDDIVNVLGG